MPKPESVGAEEVVEATEHFVHVARVEPVPHVILLAKLAAPTPGSPIAAVPHRIAMQLGGETRLFAQQLSNAQQLLRHGGEAVDEREVKDEKPNHHQGL